MKKHILVFKESGTGGFAWEVPKDFAPFLFESEDEPGNILSEKTKKLVRQRGDRLREEIQETIAVYLLLLMESVEVGMISGKPEQIDAALKASRKSHLAIMEMIGI